MVTVNGFLGTSAIGVSITTDQDCNTEIYPGMETVLAAHPRATIRTTERVRTPALVAWRFTVWSSELDGALCLSAGCVTKAAAWQMAAELVKSADVRIECALSNRRDTDDRSAWESGPVQQA